MGGGRASARKASGPPMPGMTGGYRPVRQVGTPAPESPRPWPSVSRADPVGGAWPNARFVASLTPPDPGEGPSETTRRNGCFRLEIHARTSKGARYRATVAATGDPGYAATAMMMGESALCLALDRDLLPRRAGVLTPAVALDGALADRLRAAGMTLAIERRS